MRLFFPLLAALLVGSCFTTPNGGYARESPRATAGAGLVCGGRLQRLDGSEISRLVVGARMRFAGDPGACPGSVWATSNWELEFKSGGEVLLQTERADQVGHYVIYRDSLCISSGSTVDCHQLYRDEHGRIYLAGASGPNSLPAMVTIVR